MHTDHTDPNYCFILKCLAGVALFSILLALLAKPAYIVVAAASLTQSTVTAGFVAGTTVAASSLLFPMIPIIAGVLFLTLLAATLSTMRYTTATSVGVTAYPTWNPFVPAFWFGPTYVGRSWWWNPTPHFSSNTHFHTHGNGIMHRHTVNAGGGHSANVSAHPSTGGFFSPNTARHPVSHSGGISHGSSSALSHGHSGATSLSHGHTGASSSLSHGYFGPSSSSSHGYFGPSSSLSHEHTGSSSSLSHGYSSSSSPSHGHR